MHTSIFYCQLEQLSISAVCHAYLDLLLSVGTTLNICCLTSIPRSFTVSWNSSQYLLFVMHTSIFHCQLEQLSISAVCHAYLDLLLSVGTALNICCLTSIPRSFTVSWNNSQYLLFDIHTSIFYCQLEQLSISAVWSLPMKSTY